MTLGLLYLLSLIVLDLWFLYVCGILRRGMGLEGTDAIVIPLLPLWLASGVTVLVWIFLRRPSRWSLSPMKSAAARCFSG